VEDGAEIVGTGVYEPGLDWVRERYAQVELVADEAALVRSDIDVYAPCALGGALDDETVPVLRARIVAGAANNQLAHPGIEKLLEERGILYAPDYVVNAGGVIQVADEIEGFDFARAKLRAMGRGRAKAKQTKVARELKYHSPNTDLAALQRELASNGRSNDEFDQAGHADDDSDDEDEDDDGGWTVHRT